MERPITPGDVIHGYAGGLYDDSYDCRVVVEVGPDWAQSVNARGMTETLHGRDLIAVRQYRDISECPSQQPHNDITLCPLDGLQPYTSAPGSLKAAIVAQAGLDDPDC